METVMPLLVLTPRERDVVRCIIAGKTNREIARELRLREQAVKNVLSTIYLKCHVRNRLELALFAVAHDLLGASTARGRKYERRSR
jgi:two-component system nitrate/nitrite response regulator NarL